MKVQINFMVFDKDKYSMQVWIYLPFELGYGCKLLPHPALLQVLR